MSKYRIRIGDESKVDDYGYDCKENEYRIVVRLLSGILVFCASHGETIRALKRSLSEKLEDRPHPSQIVITTIDPSNDEVVTMNSTDLITGPLEVNAFIKPPSNFMPFLLNLNEMSRDISLWRKSIKRIFNIDVQNQCFDIEYNPTNMMCTYRYTYIVRVFYNENEDHEVNFRSQFLETKVAGVNTIVNPNQFLPAVRPDPWRWPECDRWNIPTQEELETKVVEVFTMLYDRVKNTLTNLAYQSFTITKNEIFRAERPAGVYEDPPLIINHGFSKRKSKKSAKKGKKKSVRNGKKRKSVRRK